MAKLEQKLALIQQGNDVVTVTQGKVPVFRADSSSCEHQVPMTVNFLRSGCPAVQIVYQYEASRLSEVYSLFAALERPGESFVVKPKEYRPNDYSTYNILTITREDGGR